MGIDQEDMIDDEETIEKSGAGQADTLFLVSIDTKKKKTSILNISRESVVDVDIYDVKGQYYGIKNEPICLAYAYGDGRETSCENTVRSATRLLYGIPIQSYASLNLSGIAKLNDAVGGVNVEVLEDIPYGDSPLTAGEQVTLIGDNAELYVRYRDVYSENIATNNDRMARQKQYIQAYIKKVFSQMKYNITLPLELYQIASDYMVTNIGASKVSYLASQAKDCGISDANIITIPGKTFEHNGHAWYNVDNDKLFRIILDTYYTQEN
jgi:LCP family protein required for cell wall assembly